MRHRAIARDTLGQQNLTQQALRGFELTLRTSMLITERDLEVQHLLAITDKAERSRLDDTRVNRAHIDLVQRRTLHLIEGILVNRTTTTRTTRRRTQRLIPRHTVVADTPALSHIALEGVHCGELLGQRGQLLVIVIDIVRSHLDCVLLIVQNQAPHTQTSLLDRHTEVVRHVARGVAQSLAHGLEKFGIRERRNLAQVDSRAIVICCKPFHNLPIAKN